MEHLIKEMGIEQYVNFHGWIESNKMNTWYKKNNIGILLHTSVHEGHSYAIMEAMSRGMIPFIHNFYSAFEKIFIPPPAFIPVAPKRRILQYCAKY